MSLHVIELCAGGGGAHLGMKQAGAVSVLLVERDEAATRTLLENGCGPVLRADIEETDLTPWRGAADLVWASPPCPRWSTAGDGTGVDLWPATLRVIKQVAPRWVLVENVKGAPGAQWAADLRVAGYAYAETRVLNAANYGVPQCRERRFVVAGPCPIEWPQQTHWKHTERSTTQLGLGLAVKARPRWVSIQDALGITGDLVPGNGGNAPRPRPVDQPAHTVTASCPMYHRPSPTIATTDGVGMGSSNSRDLLERLIGRRRLSAAECALLQDFPPEHVFHGTSREKHRQIGNAVPPTFARILTRAVIEADQQHRQKQAG